MYRLKYCTILLFNFCLCTAVQAQQTNKIPAGVTGIFDKLPIDDPAVQSILQPGEDSLQKIRNNIFVTVTVSSTRCYIGEPVMVTCLLYSALQSTSEILKAPSYAGFSVQAMEPENENVVRKKVNGRQYRVFTLQQVQLTALREGRLTIEPVSVYNEVHYRNGLKHFQYSGITASQAVAIYAEPLPVAGRPDGFTGATGNFTLRACADSLSAAGENNLLHISITGTGNFIAAEMPAIQWPAGCAHFAAGSKVTAEKNSFPPAAEKTFTIPFVPSTEGNLVIPALQLSFFDTKKKVYKVAYSNPVAVLVLPARHKAPAKQPALPLVKKGQGLYYYLLLIPFALVLLLIVRWYKRGKRTVPLPAATATRLQESEPTAFSATSSARLQALKTITDQAAYATAFKKILTLILQRQTSSSAAEEGILLQMAALKDAASAATIANLYAQCNRLLYTAQVLTAEERSEMEKTLNDVAARLRTDF